MSTASPIDPRFDENPTLPGLADPFPIFRAVREHDPVHWCTGAQIWAITRYDDAQAVLKSPHLSRQAYLDNLEARIGPQPIIAMQRHELVFMDNPRHGELRQVIGEAINAQSMHVLQAKVDALIERKLAPLRGRGQCDLIADFFHSLPVGAAGAWPGRGSAFPTRTTTGSPAGFFRSSAAAASPAIPPPPPRPITPPPSCAPTFRP